MFLSIYFDRDRNRRRNELTTNNYLKLRYHVKIKLSEMFGFSQCQEKNTYGLGYRITLTRNKDEAVLQKTVALDDATIKNDRIHWYVPPYTSSIQQQGIFSKQVSSKKPTELRYIEQSVFL